MKESRELGEALSDERMSDVLRCYSLNPNPRLYIRTPNTPTLMF